jgi:ParB-like chromosome segregation protein Spo0J
MKIELRRLVDIVPYKQNARKIPQRAIDKVATSLKEFGWQQPIVIDKKGVIVAGHTRWLAAQQLGWTVAPVHVADNLTAAQIRQYRLMDNRSHEETAWDLDILGLELKEMKGLDIDLELAGFDIRELNSLLQTTNEAEDDAPPLPEVAFTQPGDLWTMGELGCYVGTLPMLGRWSAFVAQQSRF